MGIIWVLYILKAKDSERAAVPVKELRFQNTDSSKDPPCGGTCCHHLGKKSGK